MAVPPVDLRTLTTRRLDLVFDRTRQMAVAPQPGDSGRVSGNVRSPCPCPRGLMAQRALISWPNRRGGQPGERGRPGRLERRDHARHGKAFHP